MHPRPTSACWYKSTRSSAGVSFRTLEPVKQVNCGDTLTQLQLAARTRVARQYSYVCTSKAFVLVKQAHRLSYVCASKGQ